MRRRFGPSLLLLVLVSSPPTLAKVFNNPSWTPAMETGNAVFFGDSIEKVAQAQAPLPTEPPAPRSRFAGMRLLARDGSRGYNTCGFDSGDGAAFTCVTAGETCAYEDSYVGCCTDTASCQWLHTTCIDYGGYEDGQCNQLTDGHTICCETSTLGECYTYLVSSSQNTFTLLGCAAVNGTSTMLDYNPFSPTPTPSPSPSPSPSPVSSSSSSSTTSTSPAPTKTGHNDDTDVAAIAGGAAGGGVALIIALVGGCFLWRRNKKKKARAAAAEAAAKSSVGSQGSPPQHMSYYGGSGPSPQGFPPSSPSNGGYPSSYGYPSPVHQQQPYNQPMGGAYSQNAWQPQQQQQMHQYQQPGQNMYMGPPPGAYQQAQSTSPPPHTSPSPHDGLGSPGHQQQPATELGTTAPVGQASNRAELS